jgi:hypothetical protein
MLRVANFALFIIGIAWIINLCRFDFLYTESHPSTSKAQSDQKEAPIFILTGQSNALGQHLPGQAMMNLPSSYKGLQPHIQVWQQHHNGKYDCLAGFAPMFPPFNTRDKQYNNRSNTFFYNTGWGVEQSWMHEVSDYYCDTVYLLKNAIGALGINSWDPAKGAMFIELSEMIRGAKQQLVARGKHPEFRGLVWMQGEADHANPNYFDQLSGFAKAVRSLDPLLEEMPFIMIRIKPDSYYYSKLTDSAFLAFRNADSLHNFVLNPHEHRGVNLLDDIHYSDPAKLILGKQIFDFQLSHHQLD